MSNGLIRVVMHGIQGPPGVSTAAALAAAVQTGLDVIQTGFDAAATQLQAETATNAAQTAASAAGAVGTGVQQAISAALYANGAITGGLPSLAIPFALAPNEQGYVYLVRNAAGQILESIDENDKRFPADPSPQIKALAPNEQGIKNLTVADGTIFIAEYEDGTTFPPTPPEPEILTALYISLAPNEQGYKNFTRDNAGVVLEAEFEDGDTFPMTLPSRINTSENPVPTLQAVGGFQQVFSVTGRGAEQVTFSPFNKLAPSVENVRLSEKPYIKYASDSPLGLVAMRTDGVLNATDPGTIYHRLGKGQSNGAAATAFPLISVISKYPTHSLMFNGDVHGGINQTASSVGWNDIVNPANIASLVPLVSTTALGTGETSGPSFVNFIEREIETELDGHTTFLYSIDAIGSAAYPIIRKNPVAPFQDSQIWENGRKMMQAGYDRAQERGDRWVFDGVDYTGGEGDEGSGGVTPGITGKAPDLIFDLNLQQLYTDTNDAAKVISPTNPDMLMLMWQPSNWARGGNYPTPVSVLLMLNCLAANPNMPTYAPAYMLPHNQTDGIHLTNEGQFLLGEYRARCWSAIRSRRVVWQNFVPTASRTGAVITLTFPAYFTGLTLDTTTVSDPGDFGFEYSDDHAQIFTVDDVTNRLTITGHGMAAGLIHRCYVSTSGTLPGGLFLLVPYYARVIDTNTVTLHLRADFATANINTVDITSAGTGLQTLRYPSAAISGVAIISNQVVITLDKTPTGLIKKTQYAYTGYSPINVITPAGPTTGPRGCLRDNRASISDLDGRILYNYALTYQISAE